jgi:hypothetical protein
MGKKIGKTEKTEKLKKFVIVSKGDSKTHVEVEAKDIEDALTKALATGKLKNGALSAFTPSEYKKLSKK